LILIGAPLAAFAALIMLDTFTAAVALFLAYRRFPTNSPWIPTLRLAQDILRDSWPFLLSGLATTIYMRIDQLMIKALLNLNDVGLYAAAMQLAQLPNIVPSILVISLAPFVARAYQSGHANYLKSVSLILRLFVIISFFFGAIMLVMSANFVSWLYGDAYKDAVPIANIQIFTNVFIWIGSATSLWASNSSAKAVLIFSTGVAVVSGIGLNFLLLPTAGVIGAAWAALLSQVIAVILVPLFLSDELRNIYKEALLVSQFKLMLNKAF
jgi:O-antigen/teichoic acid export membrane protein